MTAQGLLQGGDTSDKCVAWPFSDPGSVEVGRSAQLSRQTGAHGLRSVLGVLRASGA